MLAFNLLALPAAPLVAHGLTTADLGNCATECGFYVTASNCFDMTGPRTDECKAVCDKQEGPDSDACMNCSSSANAMTTAQLVNLSGTVVGLTEYCVMADTAATSGSGSDSGSAAATATATTTTTSASGSAATSGTAPAASSAAKSGSAGKIIASLGFVACGVAAALF